MSVELHVFPQHVDTMTNGRVMSTNITLDVLIISPKKKDEPKHSSHLSPCTKPNLKWTKNKNIQHASTRRKHGGNAHDISTIRFFVVVVFVFDIVNKTPVKVTYQSPGFESKLHSWFQIPESICLEKQE